MVVCDVFSNASLHLCKRTCKSVGPLLLYKKKTKLISWLFSVLGMSCIESDAVWGGKKKDLALHLSVHDTCLAQNPTHAEYAVRTHHCPIGLASLIYCV